MPSRTSFGPKAAAAAVGLLLLLTATGLLAGVFAPVRKAVFAIAAPLASFAGAIGLASTQETRDAATRLVDIEALRAENAALRGLRTENDELRAALDFRTDGKDDLVTARVIARTSDDIFHGLVIDRGEEDGVRAGQPVVAGDGVIVGKVRSVRARTASVMLLTDTKSRLAITVHDETGTVGVLEGERGLGMRVTLIPASAKIAPGDPVTTSGLEPGVRRGLVIGTVDQVIKNAQDPFQSATVVPFAAALNPSMVQIVRDAAPEEVVEIR